MGLIDDYLSQIKDKSGQPSQMSILGKPSRNVNQPASYEIAADRPSNVQAIGNLQSMDDRYNPKEDKNSTSSMIPGQNINMMQPPAYEGDKTKGNPIVADAFGVAKIGTLAYTAADKALNPVALSGPNYETMDQAIRSTADPMAKAILADMEANQASNLAITGGTEAAGVGAETAAGGAGAATLGGTIGGVVGGVASGMWAHAIRVVGTTLLSSAFSAGGKALHDKGVPLNAENPLYSLGYTLDYKRTPSIDAVPFSVADLLFGEDEKRDKVQQLLDPVGDILKAVGTVICTELYIQKRISRETFKADAKFGKQMDKHEYEWYLSWAIPTVEKMKKSKVVSFIVSFFMAPVSRYMAGEMGVGEGSLFGKVNFRILQIVCGVVGSKK